MRPRAARRRATPERRRRKTRTCIGRLRTTRTTLRAGRSSRLRRTSQRPHNMRRLRAARTAAARIAIRPERREPMGRRRGLQQATPITRRRLTRAHRRTPQDAPASAHTAEAGDIRPVRTTAQAGATDRAPRTPPAVTVRWARILRRTTREAAIMRPAVAAAASTAEAEAGTPEAAGIVKL